MRAPDLKRQLLAPTVATLMPLRRSRQRRQDLRSRSQEQSTLRSTGDTSTPLAAPAAIANDRFGFGRVYRW